MNKYLFENIVNRIGDKIKSGLPGEVAHSKMSPQHRKPASIYLENETNYKTGCVMALLYPDEITKEARLILIERSGGDNVHAGQISFPGGKIEEADESTLHAALRETEEEIGINHTEVQILGALTSLYIPPSKFLVYPFVGILKETPKYMLSDIEVKRTLSPMFSEFSDSNNIKSGEFKSARGYSVIAPYYEVEDVKIWGATAMMISEIVALAL